MGNMRARTFRGGAVQRSMNLILNGQMKNRTEVYAADLYVLLQREFRRRQVPECQACYVQLPFLVDRQDADSPNWEVVVPPPCRYGCQALIEELVNEFAMLYDLRPDDTHARA
jgi:hypothetical protein